MSPINAQSIINAVNAAAAMAPAVADGAVIDAMPKGTPYGYDGAAEYGELAHFMNLAHGYSGAGDRARKNAIHVLCDMQDSARAELRALFNVPEKIKIQTSERGFMRLVNTRERLQAFAATVRGNAKAFGGGLVRTPKAKPAQAWSAGAVRIVRESIEDRDYVGALQLAESKAGALFYKHKEKAFMLLAPMVCEELPGLLVAQHEKGHYVAFEPLSGYTVGSAWHTQQKTRAGAIRCAAFEWDKTEEERSAILEKGRAAACDQAAARSAWIAEHGIQDAEVMAARIDDSEAAACARTEDPATVQAQAAQDVAQLVASATAAAAIEQASEAAALQALGEVASAAEDVQAVRELATICEASASSAGSGTPATIGHAISSAAPGGAPGARLGQVVQGKSGNWRAVLYRDGAGRAAVEFSGPGGYGGVCTFDNGRERMQALQKMAECADTLAATSSTQPPEMPARPSRAPRPYAPQALVFELRGITWKIEVARYWKINDVAEDQQPDVLTWSAHKKGGRYSLQHFVRVPGDSVPRDVAAKAHNFCMQCIAEDAAAASTLDAAPPAPQAVASDAAADTPAPAADYTNSPKTPAADSSTLHNSPQDLAPGVLSIIITRFEGLATECGQPVKVASFDQAADVLRTWSETAPKTGGYDKCGFSITWPKGGTYEGRYDLKHHSIEAPSLARHVIDYAEFLTGTNCPAHMTEDAYAEHLERVNDATRAAMLEVLETLRGLGVYFKQHRPIAIDLRALVAEGVKPAQMVGMGVQYTPKNYTDNPAQGAIVSAEPCSWHGVRVVVHLEDGRAMHEGARDFDSGGCFRLNAKVHGAPYLAQLAAAVATLKASKAAEKTRSERAHAAELARLAAEYPQLHHADNSSGGGKHAAINARILLKAAFKGKKFSVTSDRNSLRVRWTGGPTDKAVNAVIGRFDIGAADYNTDYFYTVGTAWSELFGGVQYLNTDRTNTEEETRAALVAIFGEDGPSYEDWRAQKMWSQVPHGTRYSSNDEWQWLTMVRRYLNGESDI